MSTLLTMAFLFLILLSPLGLGVTGNSSTWVATTMRPLGSKHGEYVTLQTQPHHKHRFFRSREVRGCKPRGFRPPPSGPSRYVNYHVLGSLLCNTRGHHKP
ncbi:hypothetical protein COCNU_07G010640 [Cocos nucifera]|uniref:Secreted protein n=1 Tax=Cocos nucifera TaxID=13894 RepID=A0A8K0N554_COCNU|nr:hypothetical protein COCNU_07G010640 [Cocos nucifera]